MDFESDSKVRKFKRRHTGDFLYKENTDIHGRRSFASIASANLSEEAGIQPLSPDKKNCLFPKRIPNKRANKHTSKMYNSDCNIQNADFCPPKEIPASFFLFKNRKPNETKCQKDFFNLLPDDMILKLLGWLPKSSLGMCSQVSKRLNKLCQEDVLWKRVDVAGKILSPSHLKVILAKKPIYARFSRTCVIGCELDNSIDCTQLKYLDMSMSEIKPDTLSKMFLASPNITKLSLEHLTVTNEVLMSMETFAGNLDTLNLTMAYDINPQRFAMFLKKAKCLEKLNIGCIKQNWTENELLLVISGMPNSLDQLNISGFKNCMTDNHIRVLVRRCPSLIELDLSDCQELTDVSMQYISRKLNFLQHLCLSRCYNIEPVSYKLLQKMSYLRYLELFSLFKDSALRTISTSLPGIQINSFPLSAIARPTVGLKRSSIWGQRVRD